MQRRLISTGSPFEKAIGFSRAVVDGDWVFVAGTTGFDYETMAISDDPVAQTHQIFATIKSALAEAGSRLEDVVRAQYFVVDETTWAMVTPVIGAYMKDIRPAATAVITRLLDPRLKLEVEVTARKRS